jgi:hypothetical protein
MLNLKKLGKSIVIYFEAIDIFKINQNKFNNYFHQNLYNNTY